MFWHTIHVLNNQLISPRQQLMFLSLISAPAHHFHKKILKIDIDHLINQRQYQKTKYYQLPFFSNKYYDFNCNN